jgi:hypothetical protein
LSVLLLALAVAAGVAWWLRQQAAEDLRSEIAQLEAMRADPAAVVRLRGEIERTKDKLDARERALATSGK